MKTVNRYFAALHLARNVPEYVKQCRAIVTKMTGNSHFASPTLALAQVSTHIDALDLAEQATHKGTRAATADRDARLLVVRSDMHQLKAYVQSISDTNIADSKVIIESAGMSVMKRTTRTKPDLAARYGKVPATVILEAKASERRASYQWQLSTDQKAWTDLTPTVRAATSVTGLTPATIYSFRFRTVTVPGLSDWSTVVSIIAH